jgi:hypothetical protein
LICVCVLAAPAHADFRWEAPATCPKADAVRARLAGDLPDFRVDITRERGEFVARLVIGDEVRNLSAPRCDDLANAVAVIVARLAHAHPGLRVAIAAIPMPPEPPPVPEFDLEMPAVYVRRAEVRPDPHWGGGGRLVGLSGVGAVPEVGLGVELAGYLRHDDGFLELAAARWGTGGAVLNEGAPARVAIGLDVLALRAGWGPEDLPIRVWGSVERGSMTGEGYQLGDPRLGSGTWTAIGTGFGVVWPMFPNARLVGSFEVAVPVQRPSFVLASGDMVYQPSLLTARVAFGLEVGWK